MARVYINNQESFDYLLKMFIQQCNKEGIKRDYGDKSFFMSGGEKRKLKSRRAQKRATQHKR